MRRRTGSFAASASRPIQLRTRKRPRQPARRPTHHRARKLQRVRPDPDLASGRWNPTPVVLVGSGGRITPPAFRPVLLIKAVVWLVLLFAAAVFEDLLWRVVVWLLRLPLKVIDYFAAFWLFALSPAYRTLQLTSYQEAASIDRSWLRVKAGLATCAGLGVAGALAAFALV